ncbi:Uncharacterised protein [Mycobacteroides abscessus subsp. abscessus]|nr:Uncharacterised protein [Mycobacteroides abscessus subsp. abscessus]SKW85816.1 Uncharacterised protein [Mycobacteroides abscessus subsp. abscessus]
MYPLGTVVLPRQCRVTRRTVRGFTARLALHQAYSLTVRDINRR